MTEMLSTQQLSYTYPQGQPVLHSIDLVFRTGQITAVIGPNGSGKTTLFQCLNQSLRHYQGTITYQGQDLKQIPLKQRSRDIAIITQQSDANLLFTVEELVSMGRSPYHSWLGGMNQVDKDLVQQTIELVGLETLRDRPLNTLSGGQQQLVWLAMALVKEPQLLLLDEPTTYLDIRHQLHFLSLIRQLNRERGLTVGLILHDLNQVLRYCDQVYLLDHGRIVADGIPGTVITPERIKSVYDVDAELLTNAAGDPVLDIG